MAPTLNRDQRHAFVARSIGWTDERAGNNVLQGSPRDVATLVAQGCPCSTSKVAAFPRNEVTVDRASDSHALEAHRKEDSHEHVAIDLGGKESQICIRQPDGTIIEERKVPTRKLTELVTTWAPSRVVMETSAEAFKVADTALAAGHQVRVVPATLVRLLGVGERGVKNDQRDAQQLSKASWQTDMPSVHIPSKPARELKSICGARDVLVGTRTKLSNNVRLDRIEFWQHMVPAPRGM
jgi:Transposase